MSEKISVLLSDVTIKGDIVEKEKLVTDSKIDGDITSENLIKNNNRLGGSIGYVIFDEKYSYEIDSMTDLKFLETLSTEIND